MKKIGLMIVALSLSLSVAASASSIGGGGGQTQAEKPASKSRTEQPRAQRTSKMARGDQAQSSKALADQIAQLKQEHQTAMNELQEIRKLASDEKATRTLGALDKLIARRNQSFQERLNPLQQRLSKLEARGKGGDKDKDKPGDVKAKTNGDKGKVKTRAQ